MKFDLAKILEVFSFKFDHVNPLTFTSINFWILFLGVMICYTLLDLSKFVRVAVFAVLIAFISLFYKNGDFMVLVGFLIAGYGFIYSAFSLQRKVKIIGIIGLVLAVIATAFYVFYKAKNGRIYFNINPLDFWLLFLGLIFMLSLFKKKLLVRSIFLTGISVFFYYKSSEKMVLLLGASLIINYFLGKYVYVAKTQRSKKWIIALSVTLNLLILGVFKYAYFFTGAFNNMFGTEFVPTNVFAEFGNWIFGEGTFITDILLPVGVSFFTFQSISYVIDIYRNEIKPVRNFFDYTFFVTYFPQLVAGPIVRARDFIPQIYKPFELTKADYSAGVVLIVTGLLKKVVLADFIAVNFIDLIADAPQSYPGFVSVLAMWGYSLQIYGDFSGYTDIAIGLSGIMGFTLLKNFDSPYKAKNVAEFWRRWHKSLGSWLRDYLYIPLGGNKSGGIGTLIATLVILFFLVFITGWYDLILVYLGLTAVYLIVLFTVPGSKKFLFRDLNLLITMIVGGLWHGASENFVIWGAMNGVALVFYTYWKRISPYENSNHFLVHFWKIFITFNFISFTRIWFRLDEAGEPNVMLDRIWNHFDFSWNMFWTVLKTYQAVFWVMLFGFIVHWLPEKIKDWYKDIFAKAPIPLQLIMVAVIIVLMYQAMSGESKAFVYFQF